MTRARFETRVRESLRALVTGKATEDEVAKAICGDACDQAAWWIEQADRGERRTAGGRPVEAPKGAA